MSLFPKAGFVTALVFKKGRKVRTFDVYETNEPRCGLWVTWVDEYGSQCQGRWALNDMDQAQRNALEMFELGYGAKPKK